MSDGTDPLPAASFWHLKSVVNLWLAGGQGAEAPAGSGKLPPYWQLFLWIGRAKNQPLNRQ